MSEPTSDQASPNQDDATVTLPSWSLQQNDIVQTAECSSLPALLTTHSSTENGESLLSHDENSSPIWNFTTFVQGSRESTPQLGLSSDATDDMEASAFQLMYRNLQQQQQELMHQPEEQNVQTQRQQLYQYLQGYGYSQQPHLQSDFKQNLLPSASARPTAGASGVLWTGARILKLQQENLCSRFGQDTGTVMNPGSLHDIGHWKGPHPQAQSTDFALTVDSLLALSTPVNSLYQDKQNPATGDTGQPPTKRPCLSPVRVNAGDVNTYSPVTGASYSLPSSQTCLETILAAQNSFRSEQVPDRGHLGASSMSAFGDGGFMAGQRTSTVSTYKMSDPVQPGNSQQRGTEADAHTHLPLVDRGHSNFKHQNESTWGFGSFISQPDTFSPQITTVRRGQGHPLRRQYHYRKQVPASQPKQRKRICPQIQHKPSCCQHPTRSTPNSTNLILLPHIQTFSTSPQKEIAPPALCTSRVQPLGEGTHDKSSEHNPYMQKAAEDSEIFTSISSLHPVFKDQRELQQVESKGSLKIPDPSVHEQNTPTMSASPYVHWQPASGIRQPVAQVSSAGCSPVHPRIHQTKMPAKGITQLQNNPGSVQQMHVIQPTTTVTHASVSQFFCTVDRTASPTPLQLSCPLPAVGKVKSTEICQLSPSVTSNSSVTSHQACLQLLSAADAAIHLPKSVIDLPQPVMNSTKVVVHHNQPPPVSLCQNGASVPGPTGRSPSHSNDTLVRGNLCFPYSGQKLLDTLPSATSPTTLSNAQEAIKRFLTLPIQPLFVQQQKMKQPTKSHARQSEKSVNDTAVEQNTEYSASLKKRQSTQTLSIIQEGTACAQLSQAEKRCTQLTRDACASLNLQNPRQAGQNAATFEVQILQSHQPKQPKVDHPRRPSMDAPGHQNDPNCTSVPLDQSQVTGMVSNQTINYNLIIFVSQLPSTATGTSSQLMSSTDALSNVPGEESPVIATSVGRNQQEVTHADSTDQVELSSLGMAGAAQTTDTEIAGTAQTTNTEIAGTVKTTGTDTAGTAKTAGTKIAGTAKTSIEITGIAKAREIAGIPKATGTEIAGTPTMTDTEDAGTVTTGTDISGTTKTTGTESVTATIGTRIIGITKTTGTKIVGTAKATGTEIIGTSQKFGTGIQGTKIQSSGAHFCNNDKNEAHSITGSTQWTGNCLESKCTNDVKHCPPNETARDIKKQCDFTENSSLYGNGVQKDDDDVIILEDTKIHKMNVSSDSDSSDECIEVVYCGPESITKDKETAEKQRLRTKRLEALKKQQSEVVKDEERLNRVILAKDETAKPVCVGEKPEGQSYLMPIKGMNAMHLVLPGEQVKQSKPKRRKLEKDEVLCLRPI